MNTTAQKYLITIVGPTAIGKTALSIKLAQHFNTEIISADSRQFFKTMKIGTAAPSEEELNAAPHHFIHHKAITETYSVGAFEKEALHKLDELFERHRTVIMVGGSGLYINAVINGLDVFPNVSPTIRATLNDTLDQEGLHVLQEQLKHLDNVTYNTIALHNPQRIIRALEVCIGTGKPYSSFLKKNKKKRPFTTIKIGLTAERSLIYDRINQRVDIMMKHGLLEEVKALLPYQHFNALNTVGYKELFRYLKGDCTKETAINDIKTNTRRFAKRQLTWFRKDTSIIWFDYATPIQDIVNTITSKISY